MNKYLNLALAAVCLFASSMASAANEVQLLRALSVIMHGEGLSYQQPTIDAVVANLSPVKQVFVHLKTATGTWTDIPMSYSRPAGAGQEVWTANASAIGFGYSVNDLNFALKYVVNGQTYWDNNKGSNYFVAADGGSYLGSVNVYDGSYRPQLGLYCQNPIIYGTVTVRNIAYAKAVTIVYSTDNWKTTHTSAATYSAAYWQDNTSNASNPNQYGFEEWSYTVNVGSATQLQYAVSYSVNGQTYWDNNFGQNYTVNITCY